MLDIITIFLLLFVLFLLYPALNGLTLDVVNVVEDPILIFMIKAFVLFVLLGVISYIYVRASGGGITE